MTDDATIDAATHTATERAAEAPRPARKRGGGRAGNQRRDSAVAIAQSPWKTVVNPDHPTTPLRPEGGDPPSQPSWRWPASRRW